MSEAAEEMIPTCSKEREQTSVEVDIVPAVQADISPAADLVFIESQGVEVLMNTSAITHLVSSKDRFESAADWLEPDCSGNDELQMPV